ncbi:MAG: flagellar basal-body protein FlbY [Ponticaulis sp.]|nr:flagellar basal-body protein FlbY [Ponticaulis sp.]
MAIAAHDIDDRLDQLIAVTRRLNELMSLETAALKARELDASSKDWEEKERLAHTYRLEMTNLAKNPDELVKASASLRKEMFETVRRFQEVLAEHSKALTAMREVTEGLVESIAREVAGETMGPRGYGAMGQVAGGSRASGIAVNAKA